MTVRWIGLLWISAVAWAQPAAFPRPAQAPAAQAPVTPPQQQPAAPAQTAAPKPQAAPAKPPAGAPATVPAQQAPQASAPAAAADSGRFMLDITGASLQQIIDTLARRLRINYIIDPRVKGTVTLKTFGEIKPVDTRTLLETVLRINGAAMVQVGDIFRIVPVADVSRLPLSPQTDSKTLPEDERMILNLVFLKYATVSELGKLIQPFLGEGANMVTYEPANLLLILDNSRSMRRTMELISVFDNDTLASQRVRLFEVKHGRPSDLARELETVMKAVSLSGEKANAPVRFLPIDRINTIVAIAPNPGVFKQVEDWLTRLDIEPKTTAGTVDNYVYRVKYGWAEALSMAIMQLYLGYPAYGMGGGYGMGMGGYGMMGMGGFGTIGMTGGYGGMGGYGMGGYGTGGWGGQMPGGGYGGMGGYGMGGYGMGGYGMGGYGMGGYGMGGYGGMYGGGGMMPLASQSAQTTNGTAGTAGQTTADQTGSYLTGGGYGAISAAKIPRVIPNPFDNTLLIQATPQDYQQVLKLLQQLDVPPRQVLVEARIYEVNMQGAFQSGVQAYLNAIGQGVPEGASSVRQLQATSAAGLTLTAGLLVGSSRQLLAVLNTSELNKTAKLVSAPTLIATDSIPARLNVGDAVPTLTGQAVGNVQTGGNSLFTQSIQNVQTGVTLSLVARVTPGGVVTLKIDQQVSAPLAPDPDASIQTPSFSNRSMSTQVTVEDGDTIAIGGIIAETNTLSSSGIPVLPRIPGIGAAFGSKNYSKLRTELVIFFTPRVIYDTSQIADASEEVKSRFKKLRPMIQE